MSKRVKSNSGKAAFISVKLQLLLIIILAFVLYGRTLRYDFIGLDEPTLIIENYDFLRNLSNIPQAFKQHIFESPKHVEGPKDYYRPVLTLSFMLDARLSEKGPQSKYFHLFNIIYHVLASFLLLIVLRKLKSKPVSAFTLSILFLVHPILTQAVAWVPGRNDTLIAIFALLSFWWFLKLIEERNNKNLFLFMLFFGIALFTKESAIVIPAICIFYLLLFSPKSNERSILIFKIAGISVIITMAWFYLRYLAVLGAKTPLTPTIILSSLSNNIPLLLQYIQKAVIPINPSVMSTVRDTNYLLGTIALLLIAAGVWFTPKENRKLMLFGGAWFILFITPSLAAKFFEGLEHRIYLPLVGMIFLVGSTPLFKIVNKRNLAIQATIIITFMSINFIRLPEFENRLTYWESAVKNSKYSSLACLNLGKTYEILKRYNDAIDVYKEGLIRNPDQSLLHNNIAGAYIFLKEYDKAEVEIKKELSLHPNNNFADYNYGLIRKLQGDSDAAAEHFKNSIKKDSNFLQGYQQLADHYKKRNDTLNFVYCVKKINELSN